MTTWEQARVEMEFALGTATGELLPFSTEADREKLIASIRRLIDTFPVGQPTHPHDLANVAWCLRMMYVMGFAAGAEHQLGETCVHPVEGSD